MRLFTPGPSRNRSSGQRKPLAAVNKMRSVSSQIPQYSKGWRWPIHPWSNAGPAICPRGIKRIPRAPARTRLPITPSILWTIKAQWSSQAGDVDVVMLWAACLLGFLRAGEFTVKSARKFDPAVALVLDDLSVDRHDNPSLVKIRLKLSKTDPFRHGMDIFLGQDLCPVSAFVGLCCQRW